MENKYVNTVFKFYFMAVAVLMYYFLTEIINIGIFVTFRHAFALALFGSVFIAFSYFYVGDLADWRLYPCFLLFYFSPAKGGRQRAGTDFC